MNIDPYLYRVSKVLRVVDGDTVDLRIDLGFRQNMEDRFRLSGIDAPETYGGVEPGGPEATAWLHDRLFSIDPDVLYLRTRKDTRGKYGRWLGELIEVREDGTDVNINEEMVEKGHAFRA